LLIYVAKKKAYIYYITILIRTFCMTPIQKLIDFFGGQAKTASALGVTQAAVSYWVSGTHQMSAAKAFLAEDLTSGTVTARDLSIPLASKTTEKP
jgi:DNA-binding transcriptional regulator YdaS (Cro superfamily)